MLFLIVLEVVDQSAGKYGIRQLNATGAERINYKLRAVPRSLVVPTRALSSLLDVIGYRLKFLCGNFDRDLTLYLSLRQIGRLDGAWNPASCRRSHSECPALAWSLLVWF